MNTAASEWAAIVAARNEIEVAKARVGRAVPGEPEAAAKAETPESQRKEVA